MPYPDRLGDVKRLVEHHSTLKDQTLLLALYYDHLDASDDVFLLEVITPFGHNEVRDDDDLFEIVYACTEGFWMPPGHQLHILLVNPAEFQAAVHRHWPLMRPVLDAVRQERFHVLTSDEQGEELLALLSAEPVAS
jgi:hypothetical protein